MATTFSMLSTINAALLAQGQNTVSQNDGSIEWRVLSENWPFIVESELEAGNYRFTTAETAVATYSAGKFGFDYAYPVPVGALHVRNVWELDADGFRQEIEWVQDSTSIHTDADTGIVVEYLVVEDPSRWPANFVTGIKLMLEAHILRALKEEYAEAERAEQRALGYLQRARTKSSQSRSEAAIKSEGGPIRMARRLRG